MVALNDELVGAVCAENVPRPQCRSNNGNLIFPVPVLAELKKAAKDWASRPDTSEEPRKGQPGVGEARESTERKPRQALNMDSRGGEKDLGGGLSGGKEVTDVIPSLPLAQSISKRGRPRLPDGLASPDALRMRRVYEQRGKNRKGRGLRFDPGRRICGFEEVGYKVLSDHDVDMAMRYFWGKRGMAVPSTTIGGITPSVSDFEEELIVLQPRTSI